LKTVSDWSIEWRHHLKNHRVHMWHKKTGLAQNSLKSSASKSLYHKWGILPSEFSVFKIKKNTEKRKEFQNSWQNMNNLFFFKCILWEAANHQCELCLFLEKNKLFWGIISSVFFFLRGYLILSNVKVQFV